MFNPNTWPVRVLFTYFGAQLCPVDFSLTCHCGIPSADPLCPACAPGRAEARLCWAGWARPGRTCAALVSSHNSWTNDKKKIHNYPHQVCSILIYVVFNLCIKIVYYYSLRPCYDTPKAPNKRKMALSTSASA